VQLSVVDEDSVTVATYKVMHSTKVSPSKKVKRPYYQKKLERRYRKKRPTAWMGFAKFMAKIIFKQK